MRSTIEMRYKRLGCFHETNSGANTSYPRSIRVVQRRQWRRDRLLCLRRHTFGPNTISLLIHSNTSMHTHTCCKTNIHDDEPHSGTCWKYIWMLKRRHSYHFRTVFANQYLHANTDNVLHRFSHKTIVSHPMLHSYLLMNWSKIQILRS